MLWPWAERSPVIGFKLRQKLPFEDNHIPLLRKWRKSMMEDPACSELHIPAEKFWSIAQYKFKNEEPPYDE